MNTIQAIIMGLVQGLSEFLPISSSAHIVFTSALFKFFTGSEVNLASSQEIFFDIMIHLATLFAVFIYFRHDLAEIFASLAQSFKTGDFKTPNTKLVGYICAGTCVTVVLALAFKDIAEHLVQNPAIVSGLLILTGCILFISEKLRSEGGEIGLKNSLIIGLAQGLAVFPGLSRSGLTIATAVGLGVDRIKAARYSFLLSVPIILGASMVYPLVEIDLKEAATFNWQAIIAGFLTAALSGYFCIKYFMNFLQKHSLKTFAYYCWTVGGVMLVLFAFVLS